MVYVVREHHLLSDGLHCMVMNNLCLVSYREIANHHDECKTLQEGTVMSSHEVQELDLQATDEA